MPFHPSPRLRGEGDRRAKRARSGEGAPHPARTEGPRHLLPASAGRRKASRPRAFISPRPCAATLPSRSLLKSPRGETIDGEPAMARIESEPNKCILKEGPITLTLDKAAGQAVLQRK